MDWNQEVLMALRVVVALVLGEFVGWEPREAGIRTYAAVSLGACVFALKSNHLTTGSHPHGGAADVVTGIGFLGAGVILHERGNVVGLTTAATIWATAAVGLAAGYGMYTLAVLVFGLLGLHHIPGWGRLKWFNHSLPSQNQGTAQSPPPDRDEQRP